LALSFLFFKYNGKRLTTLEKQKLFKKVFWKLWPLWICLSHAVTTRNLISLKPFLLFSHKFSLSFIFTLFFLFSFGSFPTKSRISYIWVKFMEFICVIFGFCFLFKSHRRNVCKKKCISAENFCRSTWNLTLFVVHFGEKYTKIIEKKKKCSK
jgi:hypothetical protein